MKRLRIIGLALLALFALGALAASTASAVEGVLPLKTKHFNILLVSGSAILENASKEKIKCKVLSGSGEFETDSHGKATLDFLECESGGFIVWSLGEKVPVTEKEALILAPGLFLICLINSEKLEFGLFFELTAAVHVDNTNIGILTNVTGAVIGKILTIKGKLISITFAGKEGKQEVTECKDEAKNVKTHSLASTNLKGETVPASEEIKILIQFLEEMELMDK